MAGAVDSISVLKYLTVLVCTKTIIHLSVRR